MREGKRARLSATQRTEIWRRWKARQSLHEIGRAYGKPHSCIRCLLLPRGEIPPAARSRSLRPTRQPETIASGVRTSPAPPLISERERKVGVQAPNLAEGAREAIVRSDLVTTLWLGARPV